MEFNPFLVLSIAIALLILDSSSSSLAAKASFEPHIFWDSFGQSVVIEASDNLQSLDFNSTHFPPAHHTPYTTPSNSTRVKRQFQQSPFHFQFPAGWPFVQPGQFQGQFPGFPGFPSQQVTPPTTTTTTPPPPPPTTTTPNSCITRNGLPGQCAAFRACYSFLYSSLEPGSSTLQVRNPGLVEDLRERAGPCDLHVMSNFLLFRADVRDAVCCADPDKSKPSAPAQRPGFLPGISGLHPQITMRPPWAIWSTTIATTTTTTTPRTTRMTTAMTTTTRPTQRIQTMATLFPNWPPPFITHPPSHFPSWIQQQHQPQQTTTTTTTSRPIQQLPGWPPSPGSGQRPPQMTTPAPATQAPVSSSCGYGKIVGGSQATKGEFPWLVAIMRHGRQICGGSLIDNQWILSAAHCFVNFQPHDVAGLRIQIGDYDIYSNSDGPVTIRGVTKLVRHTGFSMAILHNDIALLKLDSPVQFGSNGNNNIQPICLTRTGGYEGTSVTVAGWGGIYEGGPQPAIYKKVSLQVWGNGQCASKYGGRAPGGITSHMVCAGSPNADACRGDSGGPLMRNSGGRWEQIGIVSWGIGCGSYPGVYTRVDHYQDWIANNRRH